MNELLKQMEQIAIKHGYALSNVENYGFNINLTKRIEGEGDVLESGTQFAKVMDCDGALFLRMKVEDWYFSKKIYMELFEMISELEEPFFEYSELC